MLKVSVVVPVYNPGEYFGPCIESLISQTLPVESSSHLRRRRVNRRNSGMPGRAGCAVPPHSVIHQANAGWPGQPRNIGLDAALGEYVFFCDHDDWLGAEALQRLYDFATTCGSDVVLPKMAGVRSSVPRVVFAKPSPVHHD